MARGCSSETIDRKAREICGDLIDRNEISLEHGRTAAEAIVELDQVRAAKLNLIQRVIAFGMLPKPRDFNAECAQIKWAIKIINSLERGGGQELLEPFPEEILFSTMPAEKRERSFEAIRRILPELEKLERYETRAAARRDHAIRSLVRSGAIIAPIPKAPRVLKRAAVGKPSMKGDKLTPRKNRAKRQSAR